VSPPPDPTNAAADPTAADPNAADRRRRPADELELDEAEPAVRGGIDPVTGRPASSPTADLLVVDGGSRRWRPPRLLTELGITDVAVCGWPSGWRVWLPGDQTR